MTAAPSRASTATAPATRRFASSPSSSTASRPDADPLPPRQRRRRGLDRGIDATTPSSSTQRRLAPTQYDLSEILGYTGDRQRRRSARARTSTSSDYENVADRCPPHAACRTGFDRSTDRGRSTRATRRTTVPVRRLPVLPQPPIRRRRTTAPTPTARRARRTRFILISAGLDRVYGTTDDITNFGDVTAE